MSAIGGLSTNLLKSICTTDLKYILTSSAQGTLYENNLGDATPMDILGLLLENLDPTLTKSFLNELESTITANTRILLLEGVNPNYNALTSLENIKALVEYVLPFYKDSESLIYEKLSCCRDKAVKMIEYVNRYILLDVPGETPQDKEYNVLQDFAKNSNTVKELSTIYTPAVARVYNFRLDAKKSYKYPNPSDKAAKTVKHSFVIPQDFNDVLELDISLKYITVIASLLEYNSSTTRLTLLHLFMSIERLSVNSLASILNIPVTEARELKIEELRLAMYNTILVIAIHTYVTENPYNKDTLDIPVEQLRNLDDPVVGYNVDKFVIHDVDINNLSDELSQSLANWWRYYAYYHFILSKKTDLIGISPELHMAFNYHNVIVPVTQPNGSVVNERRVNPYDPMVKFNTLVRFSYQMHQDASKKSLKSPSTSSCNSLLNEMVKALAEGQCGERKEVDYKNTLIKPADVIINTLTSDTEVLKNMLNASINLAVTSGELDEDTYQALSSILPWVSILENILTTTDMTLVPQYVEEWAVCNRLGLDMHQICLDRNAMLYTKEVITKVYEKNKYRIDVFDDKNLGVHEGMTIYSQSKAREPETLLNFAVTADANGEKIPNLDMTQHFVSTALKEVKYITDVLTKRLELITTYEDEYANADFKSIKEIYKSMMTSLIVQLDESSTVITDALTFHYGHTELNKNLKEFKQRESRIEPVRIEQSRTKTMLEGTIDRHKNWYMKLESREFMLSCLLSDNLSPEYMKIPVW